MYGDSSISSSYTRRQESPIYFQRAALVTLVTVFLWSSLTRTLPWLEGVAGVGEGWLTFILQASNLQLLSVLKWESLEKVKNLPTHMCHRQVQNLVTTAHQMKSNSINDTQECINKAKIEFAHTSCKLEKHYTPLRPKAGVKIT